MNPTSLSELKQRAKMPARQAGGSTVAKFFETNKPAMAAVLPKHMSPDRMLKVALHAVRAVPQLLDCTTESLFGAVIQCGQLGLEPNTVMGHAYLIPFKNRRQNRTDVQMIVGYRGLIDLARRSGQIVSIAAHVVHERDEFDFAYGLVERLIHRPAMGDRGEVIAFYAVAQLKDGGHAFEVMSRDEVDAIRDASQGYRSGSSPWHTHYSEMGRKTAVRRLAKYLPLSIEFATASTLDAQAETGSEQNLSAVLDGDYAVMDDGAPAVAEEVQDENSKPDPDPDPDESTMSGPESKETVGDTPEWHWPRHFLDVETGEEGWTDSAGTYFSAEQHGWSKRTNSPAVNQDGTFRARRGVSKQQPADDVGQKPRPSSGMAGAARVVKDMSSAVENAIDGTGAATEENPPQG